MVKLSTHARLPRKSRRVEPEDGGRRGSELAKVPRGSLLVGAVANDSWCGDSYLKDSARSSTWFEILLSCSTFIERNRERERGVVVLIIRVAFSRIANRVQGSESGVMLQLCRPSKQAPCEEFWVSCVEVRVAIGVWR